MASLVIGYGNNLRSDDGAGRVVADRIKAMHLQGVQVRSVPQLAPELALDVANAETVVFVDTSIKVADTTIEPVIAEPAGAHYSTPGSLLELTATVGRAPVRAVAISLPVTELGPGTELTPMTEIAVERAVAMVVDLVADSARF